MNTADKRRRDTTLTIRVTQKEKERIQKNAAKANRNVTDYLVTLSLETPIVVGIGSISGTVSDDLKGIDRNQNGIGML